MADIPQTSAGGSRSTTDETRTGREKLAQLKARLFPPETKPERVARALQALQHAKRTSNLDKATLKYIAQHSEVEGD